MTALRSLFEQSGIRTAVVIDDAFDVVPHPDELEDADWTIFFDDLAEQDNQLLTDLYRGYGETPTEALKGSQEFINILWENRTKLPTSVLFEEYESTTSDERRLLDRLVKFLEDLGLACTKMGRDQNDKALHADLVIVDLFLGFRQVEVDIESAVCRLKEIMRGREKSPPLVVLMSRSPRLQERRNDFRDNAGLLGSTFRVVSKADLDETVVLEKLLRRLANHYDDAKRVANFVHAWNVGLDRARENFISILRRLDLSDLAQIQALLLEFEKQKLGEYLLDVSDGVLQHEIENDDDTIGAALELNRIDLTKYPAPHLVGTTDLQDLVYRMVFMHSDRLRLSEDGGKVQLQFGDLLRWRDEDRITFSDDVSLVITPACDLVRGGENHGAQRVTLLSGKLQELNPRSWSYEGRPVRTAIAILPAENRKWIRWNLKDIKTLSWGELNDLFDEPERLVRIGRFRELYAVEIQQMMLADFGRVGRPANLPARFPVDVSLFCVGTDSKALKLDVQGIEVATCYVGRDASSKAMQRLILNEQACDHIERALRDLDSDSIHQSARAGLASVKADSGFFDKLERGEIEIPSSDGGEKVVQSADNKIQATIIRDGSFDEGSKVSGNRKKAALIIKVMTVAGDGVVPC